MTVPAENLPLGIPLAWAVALVALCVAAAVTDLRKGLIPNWLTYPAILLGLGGHAALGGLTGSAWDFGLAGAAGGFALGFLPLLVVWLAGGIGGGDAKLMGAIGCLGGWQLALDAMFFGFIVAALMAVVVMVRQKILLRTLGRVWHAMALWVIPGARPADPTTADSPRIPFAVALCVGTLVAVGMWAFEAATGHRLNVHF